MDKKATCRRARPCLFFVLTCGHLVAIFWELFAQLLSDHDIQRSCGGIFKLVTYFV